MLTKERYINENLDYRERFQKNEEGFPNCRCLFSLDFEDQSN